MKSLFNIGILYKSMRLYNEMMKPLAKKHDCSSTMIDMLLFLGNNPEYKFAKDIVDVRGIKANLVSMNLEKLVDRGFVRVFASRKDRRQKEIKVTSKAEPILQEGRLIQKQYFNWLLEGIDPEEKKVFLNVLKQIADHFDQGDER